MSEVQPARRGRPPGRSPKSAATREAIFAAAVELFATRGYASTTMRGIATAAGTSVGLAYRYFPSKDAIVLELYRRQAEEFSDIAAGLPAGRLGERYAQAMELRLANLAPQRSAIAGLVAAGLDPQSHVGVLGEHTEDVRVHVCRSFRVLVEGSTSPPRPAIQRDLVEVLYAAHLGVLLFWLGDRTPNAAATHRMLGMLGALVDAANPMLGTPFARRILAQLAAALRPVFHPGPQSESHDR
ncbi:MAG: TetR/AcrR family transcriptional regulator [Myxococcota bacterium]